MQTISRSFLQLWLIKAKKTAATLSSSFWFIPSSMIAIAVIIAQFVLPYIGAQYPSITIPFLSAVNSPNTAMQIVQVAATSLITVTSIAFSMTLVALVMASNSFGPRLIRSFMQSKKTQSVLGFFTASFVYCLSIIGQINVDASMSGHPVIAVTIAFVLAVLCVFVLIFFIHHVAVSIRADSVVDDIARALMLDMQRLQHHTSNRAFGANALCALDQYPHKLTISTSCLGYVQAIEYAKIAEIAASDDAMISMQVKAGEYIYPGVEIAHIHSKHVISSALSFDDCLVTGTQRTPLQDPVFAINQLVEMALRALSPSLDDPFTAMTCIDKLAAALASFTEENLPKTTILDDQKVARVLTHEEDFAKLFEAAFNQIRQSSSRHITVLNHLLSSFHKLLIASQGAEHVKLAMAPQLKAIKESINSGLNDASTLDKDTLSKKAEHLSKSVFA